MATIKNTRFVTDLEREVIKNIIHSEYMNANNDEMIDWPIWSFSATKENKHLAGALGSLVKKGLCFCCKHKGEDETCGLTVEGYQWAKNNGLCL